MREKYNLLDWDGKDRIIKFAFITVLAAVMAVGYDLVIYWLGGAFNPDNVIEAIFGFVLHMALMLFVIVAGPVIILIIDVLAYSIFSAVVFKKNNFVSEAEYTLAYQILTVTWIAGTVISLFIVLFCWKFFSAVTSGTEFLSGLISLGWVICPSFFPLFFGYLFYIYPLKRKRH